MNKIKTLEVFFNNMKVGTLAETRQSLVAFQYDEEWIEKGFAISPFSLPLSEKVFIPKIDPFDGLFGVFEDSLPDGWGRLLLDRLLVRNGIDPAKVSILNRLAIVGTTGMGALEYRPEIDLKSDELELDLDSLASECAKILRTDYPNGESDDESSGLDEIFTLGGSSGGARPKILTEYQGEDWIIKFPAAGDKSDMGELEYTYSLCARAAGIEMTETKLFPSQKCSGYFGTKRFDRGDAPNKEKIHMISAGGLLETSHRIPNLDYNQLMILTQELTRDFGEVEKLFRLMCFNVFAHNRDDHSKNFSYIYDTEEQRWTLSPAYDLTYSNSIGGEHATCVNGNGKDPGIEDILAVAQNIGMTHAKANHIVSDVKTAVKDYLQHR